MERIVHQVGSHIKVHQQTLLAVTTVAAFAIVTWKWWSKKKNIPPGPQGWPLLGCTHLLTPDFYLKLTDLGQTYGEVFSLYIGNRLTVVLNSSRAMREAFIKQGVTFAGRPHPWVMQIVDVKEVINNGTYTDEWKEERKFILNALRKFGYGSGTFHEKISTEIDSLMEIYATSANENTPLDPRTHMPKTMANLIFSILIDERYEYNDKELLEKLNLVAKWQAHVGEANLLDVFPLLRFLPWEPMEKLKRVRDEIVAMYRRHVVEHKQTFDSSNSRDIVDIYLKERGLNYDEDRIIGMFFSFAGDAVDSLPEVMVWIVLYVCSHQNLQRRLQEEVDRVTGGSRQVNLHDRAEMPLLEASIMEALRLSSFVPLTELHCPLEDTTLFGYDIPKGCAVLGNIYAAHVDANEWDNPMEFNPDRFLDAEGKIQKPDSFMPYSLGRRMCLGDQISNKVLFLFLARIASSFTLTFSDTSQIPDLQPQRWYVRKAQDFFISISHRENSD